MELQTGMSAFNGGVRYSLSHTMLTPPQERLTTAELDGQAERCSIQSRAGAEGRGEQHAVQRALREIQKGVSRLVVDARGD